MVFGWFLVSKQMINVDTYSRQAREDHSRVGCLYFRATALLLVIPSLVSNVRRAVHLTVHAAVHQPVLIVHPLVSVVLKPMGCAARLPFWRRCDPPTSCQLSAIVDIALTNIRL